MTGGWSTSQDELEDCEAKYVRTSGAGIGGVNRKGV